MSAPTVPTLSPEPSNVTAGDPVTFTVTASGASSVLVDWGDDYASTDSPGAAFSHTYASPGRYTIAVVASNGDGDTPADDVVVTVAPSTALVDGPCTPWFTDTDVACKIPTTLDGPTIVADTIRFMWDLTCRRYSGVCYAFIQPGVTTECAPTSASRLSPDRHLDLTRWVPGPVQQIVEVRVDGERVDPSWYTLAGNRSLYVLDGWGDDDEGDNPLRPWPRQLPRQPGAPGTWSVTVAWGVPAPGPLVMATKRLVCEIVKSTTDPEGCALPDGVASVTRAGVTLSFKKREDGKVGVDFIDMMLDAYGCRGEDRRRMYDPLAPRATTSVWG